MMSRQKLLFEKISPTAGRSRAMSASAEKSRKWRSINPWHRDEARERRRLWRLQNPELAKRTAKQWAKDNPEKMRAFDLKTRYGISTARWERMLIDQAGRCDVCEEPMREPEVDHDHGCCPTRARCCGRCIRALLCKSCNVMLGHANDDPKRLIKGATYLQEHERTEEAK